MKRRLLLFNFAFLIFKSAFSQGTEGDSLFYSPTIHSVKIYFSQPGWWDSLVYYKPLDFKMLASVEIDGNYIDSVGVQFKGNSSYNAPGVKKPFKIDFNEYVSGQNYDGLKTINLNNNFNDPTLMREKIFLDFCHDANILAPRATYTNLYINDTLWGFYTLVEQVNKTFLEDRYFNDAGNLFKGDPQGNLQWFGSLQSNYYSRYELKTNETLNDWSDLVHLIDEINNTPLANFYDSLETVLNTTAWIRGWAANNIFVNLDSYLGSGHNYYVYHNTATNLFDFIMWDCNEAFGKFAMGMNVPQLESLSMFYTPTPSGSRPLQEKMLQNTLYQSTYINTICEFVTNYFTHTYFDPKIDSLANVIRPYVYADPHKPYTNQNFEDNINTTVGNAPGLKSFITNRRNSLSAQLAVNGCFLSIDETANTNDGISLFPNPAKEELRIQNSELRITGIEIYNTLGMQVLSQPQTSNSKPETVDVSQLAPGMYFLKLNTTEGSKTVKFAKSAGF
jgi:spore coat protein CotH